MLTRPVAGDHAEYFQPYVDLVPEDDVLAVLETQLDERMDLVGGIAESRAGHRYAEGKWSIREILGHLSDCERVFAYRALSIGRGESTSLPGFDHDAWVTTSRHDTRTLASIVEEWAMVRHATLSLLRSFDANAWAAHATSNGLPTSTKAIPFIIAGHERHHINVINARYI